VEGTSLVSGFLPGLNNTYNMVDVNDDMKVDVAIDN
jgi:hypothetical protein